MVQDLTIIAHDIRSTHNIGSLFRTAEGVGVCKIILTGYSPYPLYEKDERLPHLASKIDGQIHKTALGAERYLSWERFDDLSVAVNILKEKGFLIAALEQNTGSTELHKFKPSAKIALLLGNEVDGLDKSSLELADVVLEIPMKGQKESFNVVQAAAMAMYHITFHNNNVNML